MKKIVNIVLVCFCILSVSCSDLFVKTNTEIKEPEITLQSSDISITENDTLKLFIKAKSTDNGALFYEWYKSSDKKFSKSELVGNTSEYREENPSIGTYYYYCKVINRNSSSLVSGKTEVSKDSEIIKAVVSEGNFTYKVEHYKQNLDGTYLLISHDSEILYGKKENMTEAVAKNYEGFEAKQIEQELIKADNSTIIKIYYDRKTVTLTFNLNGGTTKTKLTDGKLIGKYGEPVMLDSPIRKGYLLCSWADKKTIPETFPLNDETYTAEWIEDNGIIYSVEHYQENTLDDNYSLVQSDTEFYYSKAGKLTEAVAHEYTGFISKPFNQIAIASDNSTVVKIYYDRKRTPISYELNGGFFEDNSPSIHKYGVDDILVTPINPGLSFQGWYDNPQYSGNSIKTIDDTNIYKTFYAKFLYSITFYPNGGTGNITKQSLTVNKNQSLADINYQAPKNKVFYGWNTKEDLSGDYYYNKEFVNMGKNVDLYAVWTSKYGGLFGTPKDDQVQGMFIGNLKDYTSEVIIIPKGTFATITRSNDTKGVFPQDRKVKLTSYAMGRYPVTQELYERVMGNNPSKCKGSNQKYFPVENVSWIDAIIFCNKYTYEQTGSYDSCVYSYNDSKDPDTWPIFNTQTANKILINLSETGYRLPTEAEWEFAARGGNPTISTWNYQFAGKDSDNTGKINSDLDSVGWYIHNLKNGTTSSTATDSSSLNYRTHQVGMKKANDLHLNDMSGNVWEWCNDYYASLSDVVLDHSCRDSGGYDVNPINKKESSSRSIRGGSWKNTADLCTIETRKDQSTLTAKDTTGFRIVRTIK